MPMAAHVQWTNYSITTAVIISKKLLMERSKFHNISYTGIEKM